MYAIFKEGKQVTKAHSTKRAAMIEAFEAKIAYHHRRGNYLFKGYIIGEVEDQKRTSNELDDQK